MEGTDEELYQALLAAASRGDVAGLRAGLETRPDLIDAALGASRYTPLVAASIKGQLEAVRVLLELGARVDHHQPGPPLVVPTALYHGVGRGNEAMAHLLLEHGADPRIPGFRGTTVLMLACNKGLAGVVEALLLRWGVEVDEKDQDGRTALWQACRDGHHDIARLLLERGGADPRLAGLYGTTPLEIAVKKDRQACIDLLQVGGA